MSDAGDWLVSQVVSQMGQLSADEQAAVYGAGFAYTITGTVIPMHADTAAWVATILRDFRTGPCRFCHHDLLEHTLSVTEAGPSLICDADGTSRPAWMWHAGPRGQPGWKVLLAVMFWVGIPLVTIGIAGWVMPLIAALLYKRGPWLAGALFWGALATAVAVFIESESPVLGFVVLFMWFGSAVYGGFQVKPWLACLSAGRR